MKRYNPIKTITAMLAAAMLLAGCSETSIETPHTSLPPAGMGELTLGEIRLSGSSASVRAEAATRAATPLPQGATLRLYAFKKGVTSLNEKLATRTYTVAPNGKAVLDAGQEPLFMPAGDADIYLVGPVEANVGTDTQPLIEAVAGEWNITPHQGIDLIGGYATASIVPGNQNPLPTMTLEHKMARVQVVVSQHEQAVYENLVVKRMSLYQQPTTGSYTLDDTGGKITTGSNIYSRIDFEQVVEEETHKRYSITTLLMPQAERELMIGTTFECNQKNVDMGDNHPTVPYRQSGLISSALAAGSATQFTTAPLTPIEIKWRTKVLPWNDIEQGEIYIPGPAQLPPVTNGLVGHYDGKMRPEMINGIWVWRDCSSQQNHGKLLEGTTWDAESGSYIGSIELIKEAASYMYNSQNGMTLEMIWKRPHVFNDISIFRIGRPNDPSDKKTSLTSWKPLGSKYCEWTEGTFRRSYLWGESTEEEDVNSFAYWAWAKGGHEKASGYYNRGYKNGIAQGTGSATTVKPLAGENLIAFGHEEWQLKAVRIYNRQLSDDEIRMNYEFDKRYHSAGPPPPYVEINGLLWAKGNLVATNSTPGGQGEGGCKIGAPGDGGLYFQFGSLIGYKGGNQSNGGTGVGMPQAPLPNSPFWGGTNYSWDTEAMVWPKELVGTKTSWGNTTGIDIQTLDDYYFNYSLSPWQVINNIRDFAVPISGDSGSGTLASGRYAPKGVGDPCTYYLGGTWRLPTEDEYAAMCNKPTGGVSSSYPWDLVGASWVTTPVIGGNFFSNRLFFPASGARHFRDGSFVDVSTEGHGVSSKSLTAQGTIAFNFSVQEVLPKLNKIRCQATPVRCVADK